MMEKNYFLENLDKSDEIRIDLGTSDPKIIGQVVGFFQENESRYGTMNSSFSKYGRLYLQTCSDEQKKAFFEDVFSENPPPALTKIVHVAYEEAKYRLPEKNEWIPVAARKVQKNVSSIDSYLS